MKNVSGREYNLNSSYNAQKYIAQEFTDKMVLNDVQQFLNLANEDENCQTSKIY